jgi:hypothetical protein
MSVPRVSSPVTQLAYQSFFSPVDDPVPAAPGPCAPKPMLNGTRSESAVAALRRGGHVPHAMRDAVEIQLAQNLE